MTFALSKPKPVIVETNKIVEKMVEIDSSLTETDLLQTPCSEAYIATNSDLLCREMFCRMNARSGNNSNTATSKECESISNLLNTLVIIRTCGDKVANDDKARDHCEHLFEQRK